ncbi:phenylacetate--CoA ligase family protein [Phosphitispora fastidiosa]|uniref:phenylacetate--CoA ligase family protein n=1 Tax=Phosphitispora fastidiosa TaxID=2837202 RepID=UPI001E531494|nr:AMP-binding protein [Phosphitispora fastidiosa]MBU7007087.1 phenylacetate-CoA ligase [Phosphitispora fastidiosa]
MQEIHENLFLSPEKLKILQLERFNQALYRCRSAELYRRKHSGCPLQINTLEEIVQFPVTTKEELRQSAPLGTLAVSPEQVVEYHESFGTTGEPISVWLTAADFARWTQQIEYCAIDFSPGDTVLVRFPYAISDPAHIVQSAAKKRGACVVPVSSRTVVSPHTRVIKLLHKLKATVIGCLPLEAILLAETAKLMGYDPARDFPHLRGFCVAGEMLTDSRKALIEKLWNARVYNMYGTTENGNIAADCSAGRLHAAEDHFLLEVLHPVTNKPVPPGERGILAVTTLTLEACPLVRYVTGDIVTLTPSGSCSCGRTGQILQHLGRYSDRLEINGTTIIPGDLQEAVLQTPDDLIGSLWMIGVTGSGLVIRAESEHPGADTASARAFLSGKLKIPVKLELVPIGEMFDRNKLLEVSPVIKPKYVANWTAENHYPRTLGQLLSGYHTF